MPNLKPHSDYRLNKQTMTEILEIREETPKVKTFIVKYKPIEEKINFQPGQFMMVWIPGDDEIPMSISFILKNNRIGITVADVGETTHHLHQLKKGDLIGLRGPYGTFYNIEKDTPNIAIVLGGGIGIASVFPLIPKLITKNIIYQSEQDFPVELNEKKRIKGTNDKINKEYNEEHEEKQEIKELYCINGAKTKEDLVFLKDLENLFNINNEKKEKIEKKEKNERSEEKKELNNTQHLSKTILDFCTDDGTYGYHGFTTQKLEDILDRNIEKWKKKNYNIVCYSCGPEKMLYRVFQICEKYNIKAQLSLERMMRCGFGLCGLCALEPTGLLVCRDGPVFDNKILRKVSDFGKIHRDFAGRPFEI